MEIIRLEEITKIYKQPLKDVGLLGSLKHLIKPVYINKVAVDKINLSIFNGESVAFLGANGAGKSTTIKMLTGVLVPTSGFISVHGYVPHAERKKYTKSIGVVFGQRTQLWWDIPVIETFEMLKHIYEISNNTYKDNIKKFNDLLGINEFSHLSARKLSLGQRMRADIAAALLHNPKIVFLDEPTIGLDIEVKKKIRGFIKQMNCEHDTTIILTTHDLDDIEDICKRLIVIDNGIIIYDGDLLQAKDRYAKHRMITIKFDKQVDRIESVLDYFPSCELQKINDKQYIIKFDKFECTASEIISALMKISPVIDFVIQEPGINQVIENINIRSVKVT
ncbi:ATP-binding cassette domain-containing protein [Cohnella sp. LGH]|uniref:ABC transporter ATP-binding protein n=1 Tax=Cohnella sp. LGH TaxID=1619153 RepID=UPI001ADBED28|nr:ATP-binding cassette domain-containing protein [Cohnella sp. LGH]QTH41188.1 ATP-binding cassette domain-containing protein [Cohnella sp. LGH]